MLAYHAHVTTAAGASLRIGVLASSRLQADEVIEAASPAHRGAQLKRMRMNAPSLLRLVPGRLLTPTESRCRAEAANSAAPQGELPNPFSVFCAP